MGHILWGTDVNFVRPAAIRGFQFSVSLLYFVHKQLMAWPFGTRNTGRPLGDVIISNDVGFFSTGQSRSSTHSKSVKSVQEQLQPNENRVRQMPRKVGRILSNSCGCNCLSKSKLRN